MFMYGEIRIKKCRLTRLPPSDCHLFFEKVKDRLGPSTEQISSRKMPRKKQKRQTVHGNILSGSPGKTEKYGKPTLTLYVPAI